MYLSKEEKIAVFTLATKLFMNTDIEKFEDACETALDLWKVFDKKTKLMPEVKPKTNK